MSLDKAVRNIAFTRLLKISGRQYEFNFRKAPGNHTAYEVDVTDARGDRLMFLMRNEGDRWHPHGVLIPAWIEQHSALIGDAIETGVDG